MGNFRKDGLCKKHAMELKEGKIVLKVENNNNYFYDANSGELLNNNEKVIYETLPTEGFEKCILCGEKTGGFAFCHKCFKEHTVNQLLDIINGIKVENINKESCVEKIVEDKPVNKVDDNDELRCIICGKPSFGKHFCKSCYFKYKDRSVDIRITHCNEIEILDDYGNLQYKCDDGRKVRSRAEMIISNFLFNNKVRAVYEETIYYTDDKGESKTLHPDFYLPDYNLYIEYNELTNKPYLQSKSYAQKIYDKLQKDVFIMNEKDLTDISACLKPLLKLH